MSAAAHGQNHLRQISKFSGESIGAQIPLDIKSHIYHNPCLLSTYPHKHGGGVKDWLKANSKNIQLV